MFEIMGESIEDIMHDFFVNEIKPVLAPYVIGYNQPVPYHKSKPKKIPAKLPFQPV